MVRRPIFVGGVFAALAALAFGLTTPLVKAFGRDTSPVLVATLLYTGAALSTFGGKSATEAPVRRVHALRLVAVAALGSLLAPTLLAWGLARTGASIASLLLNFEALFTVGLAAALYREPLGRRVLVAMAIMVAGGALLVVDGWRGGHVGWAALAIVCATFAWALDNTLTRPFADLDPTMVVRWKSFVGVGLGAVVCIASRATLPAPSRVAALLLCGAIGYGLSLRLYLLGQRRIGAARTGSIFACAPFVGAVSAFALGDRSAGWMTLGAAALFVAAVVIHLTEAHGHPHTHEALEHEHAHRHDDGHHDHVHKVPVEGTHSHPHVHDERHHDHPHALDEHHRHVHRA